jgi:hypothetical protein
MRGLGIMKKGLGCVGALALGLTVAPGGTAVAQDTGLAGMHSWVRVGGRTCMLDHFHDGSGSGSTRAAAQRAAIRSWIDFTAWEYGGRWASYGASLSKRMSCSGGPGNYSCSTSSRPCRY